MSNEKQIIRTESEENAATPLQKATQEMLSGNFWGGIITKTFRA